MGLFFSGKGPLAAAIGALLLSQCANAKQTLPKGGVWLQPRTRDLCAYDRLRVSWQLNLEELSRASPEWQPPLLFDLYQEEESATGAQAKRRVTSFDVVAEAGALLPSDLGTSRPIPGLGLCSFKNPISCLLNGPSCLPSIVSISLDAADLRCSLGFDQPTSQPAMPSLEALLGVIVLEPTIHAALVAIAEQAEVRQNDSSAVPPSSCSSSNASSATAVCEAEVVQEEEAAAGGGQSQGFVSRWVNEGRTLEAVFPEAAFRLLYEAGRSGELAITLRPHECHGHVFSGNMSLRLSEPGRYSLDLSYLLANGSRVGWAAAVGSRVADSSWSVHACGDLLVQVAPPPHKSDPLKIDLGHAPVTSRVPEPAVASRSVLSFTSHRPLKIAQASLPNQKVGSWSLGMWVLLLEGPTGQHRTLFYKGEGQGDRTPSAWLLPASNRLTLRASVEGSPDLGSDSVNELVLGEWTHLLFIFSNDTQALHDSAQGEPGVLYATSLFVNGRHDVTVKFKVPALPNQGPLSLGKDPSHPGPRMLVSHLKIWDRALSRSQARMEYERTAGMYEDKGQEGGSQQSATRRRSRSAEAVDAAMASCLGPFAALKGCGVAAGGGGEGRAVEGEDVLVDVAQVMFESGQEARAGCSKIAERVSLFESAGHRGHAQSAYQAAMLRLHGEEELQYDYRLPDKGCRPSKEEVSQVRSTALALQDLSVASSRGHTMATRLLAMGLLSGVGVWGGGAAVVGHKAAGGWRSGARPDFKAEVGNAALEAAAVMQRQQAAGQGSRAAKAKVLEASSVAVGLLHLAAVLDDAQAQRALGVRYQNGWGVEKDLIAAGYYFEASADVASQHYHAAGQEPFHEMQRLSDATVEKVEVGQRGEEDEDLRYTIMRAEEGNVPAMVTVGDMLYWGARGMPRDHARALRYFERAAQAGDRNAMCLAAGMYLKGEGGSMNHTKAVQFYNEAADGGSVRALNGLGYAYFVGDAVEKNLSKAFSYFERAAAMESDGDSLFNAGHCLEHGLGTDKDLARAASLYRLAAEKFGHFDSAHVLGKLYMDGRVIGQDFALAIRYLEPASRMGHWGRLVRGAFDRYLARDYLGAYLLYSQAAELGYDTAQVNAAFLLDRHHVDPLALVGYSTDTEDGRQQDGGSQPMPPSEAKRWARELLSLRLRWLTYSQGGVSDAALPIGDAYYYGQAGLPQDYEMAAYWYSKGSAAGLTQGSLYLGYMYEMGLGVETADWDRAEKHYRAALQQDRSEANWVICSLALARLWAWRWLDRLQLGRGLWKQLRERSAASPSMHGAPPSRQQHRYPGTSVARLLAAARAVQRDLWEGHLSLDADSILILVLSILLLVVVLTRAVRKRRSMRVASTTAHTHDDSESDQLMQPHVAPQEPQHAPH